MAGVRPFFLTGANAKIKVNGKTLAYCTNLSYSVKVKHATPTVLGMFEPSSVEPLGYLVTGKFSVVRYVADAVDRQGAVSSGAPAGSKNTGNGIGNWGDNNVSFSNLADGRAYENLDPKRLDKATGFDIEVFQKIGGSDQANLSVARIRDTRITQADFAITKKAAATQSFNFTALYVDEDSFLADFSGTSQKFS